MRRNESIVSQRQVRVRQAYDADPGKALIVKRARASAGPDEDPLHGLVIPGQEYDVSLRFGIDRAVGGWHDAPNPAELLCAALAACEDATVRMVADVLGVQLSRVTTAVSGTVDVRGALGFDRKLPVGFSSMRCDVHIEPAPGTPARLVDVLVNEAERACIVLQTLRAGVPVQVGFSADGRAVGATEHAAVATR